MIKRIKLFIKEMNETVTLKASALTIASESLLRHHKAKRKSRKLHKAILAGKAPRGRTTV